MPDADLVFEPAWKQVELIAERRVSPVELTELYYSRIEELNPRLNSYLTLTGDRAMDAAKAAEEAVVRDDKLGPLHGLPVSIKDTEITRGVRTTIGSLIFENRVPSEDSILVERVLGAGAVMLGKTNTPEFGLLGETRNRLGGDGRNPWDLDRTPGGSSGGAAAAMAAGLCAIATGGDGGGSIRIPASFCGVYGIKPTLGRVPRYAGARAPALHNHLVQSGPLSRTVRDAAILLQVIAGYDSRDRGALREPPPDYLASMDKGVSGLRIAWSPDYGYSAVDPEVREIASGAAHLFEGLGCSVDATDLALDAPFDAFWVLFSADAYASYGPILERQADRLTDYALECIEAGSGVTGAEYAEALGYMDVLKSQFTDLFESYDLLLSPTTAVPAFPLGQSPTEIGGREVNPFWGFLPYTYPINMIGHPAASIPCGFSSDGLPIGLHIVGRMGDEETILAASAAFEQASPWAHRRPPVS
jgi:Asp-tRNA(Asn)/Glu-tRNA(Gln) amidotransferase A subunit family amidase